MYISEIHIENFRNFDNFTMDFQKGLNVIIGANNSGKTGLLNVINLLSHPSEISVDDFNKYNLSKFKEEYRDKAPKIVFEYSIQPMKVLSPFCCYYTELCWQLYAIELK